LGYFYGIRKPYKLEYFLSEITPYEEAELLRRVADGDERAFHELFIAYWPQVYGTSYHLTRSQELAKDLSQDIFLKIWENRRRLAEVEKLNAYIYVLSRNLIMDHQRKKVFNAENIDFLLHYFSSDKVTAQEKMEYKELETALQNAVNQLPLNLREVFKLSRYEGLSHPEIAARLNISVFSSRTYITRAMQEIRQYLARHADRSVVLMITWLISRR